jgi:hypothetical protein
VGESSHGEITMFKRSTNTGWWFGTFFHILGIIITDFIFFKGAETTNQNSLRTGK